MKVDLALLENWMRQYYFNTEIDIGSSGVECFSLTELYELLDFTHQDLDRIVFHDSMTLGDLSLRKTIAQRWGHGDPEWVMATHGSSEAIYLIMNTLLQAGDEVVVLDPCYQQLFSIAKSMGCQLKHWQLRFEQQFIPNIKEFKRLISPCTKLVVVNFPHNPTGTSLTLEEQVALIETVAQTGAYLLWDAAFAELTYERSPLPTPTLQYDRAISIGTLSKAYGLPGLRVGWCIAAPDVLARFVHLRDYITLHLSPLVEIIAQKAIAKADRLLAIRREQARINLDILAEWVNRHQGAVEWVRPSGGVCAFVRFSTVPDIEPFCHYIGRTYGVLLVPGTCFNYPKHARVGFGGATIQFKEGLSRLSNALNDIKA